MTSSSFIDEFLHILDSFQTNDYDKFVDVIHKLRNKSSLDIQEKKIFIELIEQIADTIYTVNNCSDKYAAKYGTNYYQQTKIYDEPELNCCSNLLNSLEAEAEEVWENAYDIAVTNEYVKSLESNKMA